jgi:hypothetical protein
LSDLPVLGQITEFAISGKMMTVSVSLSIAEFFYAGFVEMQKQ